MSVDDTYDHFVRETGVEWGRALDTLHLFRGQGNVQRHEVFLKLLDFPATDDREHVRSLLQMVRNSNCKQSAVCVKYCNFRPARVKSKIMTYLL
jgi:hypothetical protein